RNLTKGMPGPGSVLRVRERFKGSLQTLKPTAIDLFSGCGGLSLGLRLAGFDVCGAVEVDPDAVQTYRLNHRSARVISRDIRKVNPSELLGKRHKRVDLLAACPPCQGFSRIRSRNGSNRHRDFRNGLVREVLRFVAKLLPSAVVLENVPQLASHWQGALLRRGLRRLGYEINQAVIDVAELGLPQRRKRYVLVAGLGWKPNLPALSPMRLSVRKALAHLPPVGTAGDPLHDWQRKHSTRILRLISMVPKDGGSRRSIDRSLLAACHKKTSGFRDVYGRMSWDDVSPTITGGCINPSKGRFIHPAEDRAITLREAALLQGFPSRYSFPTELGIYRIATLIGNAFPP
ncbi:partial DNA (cytosine-5)-methyltransferase 1, partial [Anaerolineae bacterium]